MRIINIITTLTFIATANSSDQNLTNKEENQPKSRKILKTFEDKTQCISDDKLFEEQQKRKILLKIKHHNKKVQKCC